MGVINQQTSNFGAPSGPQMFAQKPWSLSESTLLQTRQQQFPQLLWLTEEVAMKNLSISAWWFKFGILPKIGIVA